MAKTISEKLEAARLEKEQAEARIKLLLQQHKEQERKARTHRLIERGVLLESLIAEADKLTGDQLKTFLQKTIQSPFALKQLESLRGATEEGAAG